MLLFALAAAGMEEHEKNPFCNPPYPRTVEKYDVIGVESRHVLIDVLGSMDFIRIQ